MDSRSGDDIATNGAIANIGVEVILVAVLTDAVLLRPARIDILRFPL